MQIIMLAAHDGVTPSQYVAAAMAGRVKEFDGACGVVAFGQGRCAESVSRTLTIIPPPESGISLHDHLMPYHQA